jgi:hypothetical protein
MAASKRRTVLLASIALILGGVGLAALRSDPASRTTPATDSASHPGPFVGAVIGGDPGPLREFGFTGVNVTAWSAADDLDVLEQNGLHGILWTGGWQRASCQFETDDTDVRRWVRSVRDHAALYAIQLSDEPRQGSVPRGCPNAIDAHRARHQLVRELAPDAPTLITLDTTQTEHYAAWRGSADLFALVVYPCTVADGCESGRITSEVAAARDAGLDELIGVVQAFGNDWAKMPSPDEIDDIMQEWTGAGISRVIYYAYSGHEPHRIDNTPAVHQRIREWNRRLTLDDTVNDLTTSGDREP